MRIFTTTGQGRNILQISGPGGYLSLVPGGDSKPFVGSDANPDLTYWMVAEGTVGAGFRRVRHLKTGGYLNIESGALGVDEVQPGWWSARWVLQ